MNIINKKLCPKKQKWKDISVFCCFWLLHYVGVCRCEDLAEIIWLNRQQIRQLEMIQEGLNIPSQETSMNILPELSDGLNVLLDSLVKSSFVIEKQPPQVT